MYILTGYLNRVKYITIFHTGMTVDIPNIYKDMYRYWYHDATAIFCFLVNSATNVPRGPISCALRNVWASHSTPHCSIYKALHYIKGVWCFFSCFPFYNDDGVGEPDFDMYLGFRRISDSLWLLQQPFQCECYRSSLAPFTWISGDSYMSRRWKCDDPSDVTLLHGPCVPHDLNSYSPYTIL